MLTRHLGDRLSVLTYEHANLQTCLRRSKLELRGPRSGLKLGWARSVPPLAQMPNLPKRQAGGRAGGASRGRGPRGGGDSLGTPNI
eukprot:4631132-Alexandrium_andersonii.AAC.1